MPKYEFLKNYYCNLSKNFDNYLSYGKNLINVKII